MANLTRFDPFNDMDDLFKGLFVRPMRIGREAMPELQVRMDVTRADDTYTVKAEMPGVKKDDVTVEVHENVLTIRGEKKSEREEKKDKTHWIERSYGSFSRSFTLPPAAVVDEMKASFKDGVLTLEIPKKEEVKPRQISIK